MVGINLTIKSIIVIKDGFKSYLLSQLRQQKSHFSTKTKGNIARSIFFICDNLGGTY